MSDLEDFDEDTDCEGGEFLREKEMIARQKGNAGTVEQYDAKLAKDPDNPILQRLGARAANIPPLYPPPISGIEQRPSSGKGLGIFCTTTVIRKGSFIAPYKGRVTCHENPDSQYQIEICDGKGVYVDASTRKHKKGNPAKFVNSITRWDGSETGGANVCYYTQHATPNGPMLCCMRCATSTRGRSYSPITTGSIRFQRQTLVNQIVLLVFKKPPA